MKKSNSVEFEPVVVVSRQNDSHQWKQISNIHHFMAPALQVLFQLHPSSFFQIFSASVPECFLKLFKLFLFKNKMIICGLHCTGMLSNMWEGGRDESMYWLSCII